MRYVHCIVYSGSSTVQSLFCCCFAPQSTNAVLHSIHKPTITALSSNHPFNQITLAGLLMIQTQRRRPEHLRSRLGTKSLGIPHLFFSENPHLAILSTWWFEPMDFRPNLPISLRYTSKTRNYTYLKSLAIQFLGEQASNLREWGISHQQIQDCP